MSFAGRTVVAALAVALAWAAPSSADDFCVGDATGCAATLAAALEDARDHPGPDRVLLEAGEHEVPTGLADAPAEPVEIVGKGVATELTGEPLWLAEPASRLSSVAVGELTLAGVAGHVVGTGTVHLLAGARLSDSVIGAQVVAVAPARIERSVLSVADGAAILADGGDGTLVVEDAEITGSAFDVRCAAVVARHLTVIGKAPLALDLACPEPERASLDLRDSVVSGDFPDLARNPDKAALTSTHSLHPEDADLVATERIEAEDPGFVSGTDLRLRAGSPLIDAGEPGVLLPGEGFWDVGSLVRVTDGNADGVLRRDVGAHERQPPSTAIPAGNVLLNPGAEAGEAIMSTGEGPQPPAWTRTGSFTQVGYGTATRTAAGAELTLPTREAGDALAGGGAYFSAGPGEAGRLVQRIDVAASAREIDTGLASAALAGLLGGYGADEDEVRVTATFRDPEGGALSALTLGPVTAAERANATNLLHRSAAGAIPERTRAIDVEIAGTRISAPGSAETYTDAYADNLSLTLSVPGIPVPGPLDPDTQPPVKNLKPFSGVTVLTGRPRLSGTGRTKVRLACASATVGRCAGSLELRAQLRRGQAFSRVAQFARFTVSPGRAATVTVKLTLAARRALRRARSFRATLRAVVRDGQGLERKTTIPIRVVRSAPVRR
jgi:hypothetical protein